MNLRLPIVITVVAVAAGAAAVRSLHPPVPSAAAFASEESARPAVRAFGQTARPAAVAPRLVIYVAGAVTHAGVYRLAATSRAGDAVRAAGGANATADLVAVNLAARLSDGDEVVVPEKGAANDVVPVSDATAAKPAHRKRKKHHKKKRKHRHAAVVSASASDALSPEAEPSDKEETTVDAAPAAPVDINAADASELETLPGIGSGLADRIVTFRELNGPFNAADDLLDVAGMTQKRLDLIEPFLLL